MKTFEVIDPKGVTFHTGILLLSPDQARARTRLITPLGDDLYEIKQPVQFKAGEKLGYDGDISKEQFKFIKSIPIEIPCQSSNPALTWVDGNINEALAQFIKTDNQVKPAKKKASR